MALALPPGAPTLREEADVEEKEEEAAKEEAVKEGQEEDPSLDLYSTPTTTTTGTLRFRNSPNGVGDVSEWRRREVQSWLLPTNVAYVHQARLPE